MLAQNLQACGQRPFLDTWALASGSNLAQELYQALRQARAGVLVVTPDVWDSGWVRLEYEQMLAEQIRRPSFRIIPVLLGQTIPDVPFLNTKLWVDFRAQHDYHTAFHPLLCGLEHRAPGTTIDLPAPLRLPPPVPASPTPHADELAFLDRLFERLYQQHAIVLLGQAQRGHCAWQAELLARAQQQFGAGTVVQVSLAYSTKATAAAHYALLGQHCAVDGQPDNALALQFALEEKLRRNGGLFMLISGLENVWEAGQQALAGMLRSLHDRYIGRLRVLIGGGEKLADLYYQGGALSFLSHAHVETWPELTLADVQRLSVQEPSGQPLDAVTAQALLAVSGGHPRLLQHCLSLGPLAPASATMRWQEALRTAPFVWRLFTPFRNDAAQRAQLCQLLAHQEGGPHVPYPADALLRLYWQNILKSSPDGRRLVWRCEALRQAGLSVLGCMGTEGGV